jgi:hypothetical protein
LSSGGIEMHEVFITKGDAQGSAIEVRELIHSPFNCVLVHSENCHLKAQHVKIGKLLCVHQILLFEGATRVISWLQLLDGLFKSTIVEDEIRYVNNILSKKLTLEEEICENLQ